MKEIKNTHILFLFIFFSIFSKWIVLNIFYENHIFSNVIISLRDIQYFPLIISISNLDFSPTYLDFIQNSKIISFPLYGILLHSLFYKTFGIYSFMEMQRKILKEYFDFIHQHSNIGSYFLNINRYRKDTSGEIIKFSSISDIFLVSLSATTLNLSIVLLKCL